jgi:hypothetical protein
MSERPEAGYGRRRARGAPFRSIHRGPHWRHFTAFLLISSGLLSGCASADDAAVRLGRNADEVLGWVRPLVDDISGLLSRSDDAAARFAARSDELLATAGIERADVEDAFRLLVWDATCALVFEGVPADLQGLGSWLVSHAAARGLALASDYATELGDMLLDSLDSQQEVSDATQVCSELVGQLESSGL